MSRFKDAIYGAIISDTISVFSSNPSFEKCYHSFIAYMLATFNSLSKDFSDEKLLGELKMVYYKNRYISGYTNINPILKHYLSMPYNKQNEENNKALSADIIVRMLPYLFSTLGNRQTKKGKITMSSVYLTHPNYNSYIATMFFLDYASKLLKRENKIIAYFEICNEYKDLIKDDRAYSLLTGKVHVINQAKLKKDNSVFGALECTFWAFLRYDSLDEGLNAIKKLKCSNVVPSLFGFLNALTYGLNKDIKDYVYNSEQIESILDSFQTNIAKKLDKK